MTTSTATSTVTTSIDNAKSNNRNTNKDISIRDIFSASQKEAVALPGRFFKDVLCLPEFGGQIKEGRGVIFIIADYQQKKKKAMRVIKRPYNGGKVGYIPVNMMDCIIAVRQKSNQGLFSTIFEYSIMEISGVNDNCISAIVKEKGNNPFLPNSISDDLKQVIYNKLKSNITIPAYCKCFKSINIINWSGFRLSEIDKPKAAKFNEKDMLKNIIYTKSSTIFVINVIIKEKTLLVEWRLHAVDFKSKTIKGLLKLWDKEILLNDEVNEGELMFNSSGNKIRAIIQKYGIVADKEGREYYMLSSLR